jgi:hypothetical protein
VAFDVEIRNAERNRQFVSQASPALEAARTRLFGVEGLST